ncbi:hypothetical protein BH09SUM1_BH09SUM1_03890 [soil metagenome]
MLEIVLNGEKKKTASASLAALLEELQFSGQRCATMVNGAVVRRTERDKQPLHPNDAVEIITMVGGG